MSWLSSALRVFKLQIWTALLIKNGESQDKENGQLTFELAVSPAMRIVDLQRLISVGHYRISSRICRTALKSWTPLKDTASQSHCGNGKTLRCAATAVRLCL
jgi:hypothetical protein